MCEQKVMLNTCINPRSVSLFVFNIYLCDKVIIHEELKEMKSSCIVNTLTIKCHIVFHELELVKFL